MPGNPPSTATETEALLAYLVQQRDGLKYAAFGLTEEQLQGQADPQRAQRRRPDETCRAHRAGLGSRSCKVSPGRVRTAYLDSFAIEEADSVDSLQALLDTVGDETAAAVADLDSLDVRVQLPDAPWYPQNPDGPIRPSARPSATAAGHRLYGAWACRPAVTRRPATATSTRSSRIRGPATASAPGTIPGSPRSSGSNGHGYRSPIDSV